MLSELSILYLRAIRPLFAGRLFHPNQSLVREYESIENQRAIWLGPGARSRPRAAAGSCVPKIFGVRETNGSESGRFPLAKRPPG